MMWPTSTSTTTFNKSLVSVLMKLVKHTLIHALIANFYSVFCLCPSMDHDYHSTVMLQLSQYSVFREADSMQVIFIDKTQASYLRISCT